MANFSARGKNDDAVADRHNFLELRRYKQNGEAAACKFAKFTEDFFLGTDIDAAGWLVRKQNTGWTMTPTCQQKLLLITTR